MIVVSTDDSAVSQHAARTASETAHQTKIYLLLKECTSSNATHPIYGAGLSPIIHFLTTFCILLVHTLVFVMSRRQRARQNGAPLHPVRACARNL
jgi:hypothetical protein